MRSTSPVYKGHAVGRDDDTVVVVPYNDADHSECLANANLIAAAPEMREALKAAIATIEDYLAYEHDGDPWSEDARTMGEMDINDFETDGRLEKARAILAKAEGRS